MRLPRIRLTIGRLMLVVLFSGLGFWFVACIWNREYTETAFFWSWPATRARYTKTYGDWALERAGFGQRPFRSWTPIPDPPPPPPSGMTDPGDLIKISLEPLP